VFLCEDPNVGVTYIIDHGNNFKIVFWQNKSWQLESIGHWKCQGTNNPQHNAEEKCHYLIDIVGSKSSNKD
jgi:hypothetical protein